MCHTFFTYLSIDGHLGGFHVLAIVSSTAVSIGVHYPLKPWFPPDICAEVELLSYTLALF